MPILTIGLLVVVGLFALGALINLRKRRQARAIQKAYETALPSKPTRRRRWFFIRRRNVTLRDRVLTWSKVNLTPERYQWLSKLKPAQQAAFADNLYAFSTVAGFDLVWLLEGHAQVDTQLHQTLTEQINDYIDIHQHIRGSKIRLDIFRVYLALLKNPNLPPNVATAKNLYTILANQKIALPIPPELLLASELERQAFSTAAVIQVAQTNWPAFSQAVAQLMNVKLETAPTPPQPATQAATA